MSGAQGRQIRVGFAILAFSCLIWGMAAQALYGYVTGGGIWTWGAFFTPMIVSPMIFGTFLSVVKSDIDMLTGAIMAFQNGFFWKQIFDGLAPILKTSGRGG